MPWDRPEAPVLSLTCASVRPSLAPVEVRRRPKRLVELSVQPISRLWLISSLTLGAALLCGTGLLVLGEVLLAFEGHVLELLLTSRFR